MHKLARDDREIFANDSVAKDYLVFTGNKEIDSFNKLVVIDLKCFMLQDGIPNDIAKYVLSEAFKTNLILTINMRSLRNFLNLRSAKNALWEIRELSRAIYESLPDNDKQFYEDIYHV